MNPVRIARLTVLATAMATGSLAIAQSSDLQPRTQNDITYVTGGVGTEQQATLKDLEQQGFTLKLVFAERGTGAYLANVHVIVADASGRTVLDAMADGPAFYAKLPAGQYRVTAEHAGVRQTHTVSAGRGGLVTMTWPAEGGSAPEPAATRVPHGDAPPLAPSHAGQPVGPGR
jgi:hypothetical protein